MLRQLGPGDEIGSYRIERLTARGGMGLVYRARQRRPDRTVAIKVIAPELAADPDFRARFEQESNSAAEIEHPNVIPVYEVGEVDQLLYIAMRFVNGVDLGELLRRIGPLEPERVARIVEQVADALDAAHAAGMVHRDVKPGNVLLAKGDHVYLTDFGLTKRVAESRHVTRTGTLVGTVDYIAPEQALGRRIDASADIYALGCVTYHMLAGTVPFPRDSEIAKIYAHLNDTADVLTGVPTPLAAAVARAMAKSPADRFHSAGDFSRAVTAGVAGHEDYSTERTVARGKAAIDASQTPIPEHLAPPRAGQEVDEIDDAHAATEIVAVAPSIPLPVTVGSVIDGRYRIDAEAGRGGMATVYRATHLKLLKTVALKLMSQDLAADPEFQRRFETEARATSEVDHEHVIPVYDFGEDEHGFYIVMRYVEGPNLRDLMSDRGAFEPARAVQVIEQVAAALDAAHARGLLHRDVKPANVLVEESTSRIFLADFGLVRPARVREPSETESTAMGTEWYMAPERRNHEETKLGDVYSLGCVLWEMLAGPGTPLPAHDITDGARVSPALREVVRIAVSERPHERFHSAGGLARAARAALASPAPEVAPSRDSQPFHEPLSAELSGRVLELCRNAASHTRDPRAGSELERVTNRLKGSLSLAVAGSAGAGKSTLINALLGQRVLPTGEPTGARVITWFRHGDPRTDLLLANGERHQMEFTADGQLPNLLDVSFGGLEAVEVWLPARALRSLTIVEVPDIDSTPSGAVPTAPRAATIDADAVLFAIPGERAADDREVLESFKRRLARSRHVSAVNVIGVLTKADLMDGASSWQSAVERAQALRATLGSLVSQVLPVAGRLAMAANAGGLDDDDVTALWRLSELDAEDRERVLDGVEGVAPEPSSPGDHRLLALLGSFGVRGALELANSGDPFTRVALARRLRELSGIEELQKQIDGLKLRADALMADAALADLDALSWKCDMPELRNEIDALRLDEPVLELIQAFDRCASGRIELEEGMLAELERLITGRTAAERLGLEGRAPRDEQRALAGRRARAWKTWANGGLASFQGQQLASKVDDLYTQIALAD